MRFKQFMEGQVSSDYFRKIMDLAKQGSGSISGVTDPNAIKLARGVPDEQSWFSSLSPAERAELDKFSKERKTTSSWTGSGSGSVVKPEPLPRREPVETGAEIRPLDDDEPTVDLDAAIDHPPDEESDDMIFSSGALRNFKSQNYGQNTEDPEHIFSKQPSVYAYDDDDPKTAGTQIEKHRTNARRRK